MLRRRDERFALRVRLKSGGARGHGEGRRPAPDATLQAVEAAKQVLNGAGRRPRPGAWRTGLLDGALRAARSRADAHAKAKNEDEDALKARTPSLLLLKGGRGAEGPQAVWRVLTFESPRIEHARILMETRTTTGGAPREPATATSTDGGRLGARRAGLDAPLRLLTHSAALVPLIGARLTAAKL